MCRGSISKIASMIPGLPQGMMDGNEEETGAKLKRMIYITDAMRADELDSDGLIFVSSLRNRVLRSSSTGLLRQSRQPDRSQQARKKSRQGEWNKCAGGGGVARSSENDGGHGQASRRAKRMVSSHLQLSLATAHAQDVCHAEDAVRNGRQAIRPERPAVPGSDRSDAREYPHAGGHPVLTGRKRCRQR